MPRKSSIHFKPVSNVRFAVSHSERTDLSEPAYLLPKEHQLDNIVVAGSLPENDLAALFIQQKEGMTGQAKARGSSPFWEGVVVLPNTNGQEQSTNLQAWKKEYEKATDHKVLHMSVHLDEGYLDALGKPQYNPHAHVIVTRMDSKNRVINLDRKQLAQVQDLTAETLQMERGSTLAERQGKRGRAHVPHREFRAQADEKRLELDKPKADLARLQKLSKEWSDADLAKVKNLQAKLDGEPARLDAALKAQEAQLNEKYRLDREAMKASGTAKQQDYQALKKTHDAELAQMKKERDEAVTELKATKEKVVKMDEYSKKLEADLVAGEAKIAQVLIEKAEVIEALVKSGEKSDELLKTAIGHRDAAAKLTGELAEVKAKFATMANNYQADKAAGTPAHLISPDPAPRTSQSNTRTPDPIPAVAPLGPNARAKLRSEQMAQEATKTPLEAPKQVQGGIPSPTPSKTPREAFLELYGHIKTVLVGLIDGMRLDAVEGRLGLFSSHSKTGPRVQVLCEVPLEKAMPVVGQCFDSRARPGKGGIGD
jgi:hypothetical protein